ncbi:MAG: hypothetical protein WA672_00825, partial [Candidatus Angelobacter sp.]
FQRLCFHILHDRHPEAKIHHVEGQSGDKGLDLFAGDLEGRPAIWQCKSFPNGVGESQKSQIRESLTETLKHFKPNRWVLCLSVDMNEKAASWFQKFQKSKVQHVEVGLFSASNIVHELMHNRPIRNNYFPGVGIDITEWKRVLSKTGGLTDDELSRVTEINMDEFLERMKERDSRFNYELIFSDKPSLQTPGRVDHRKPLLTFSSCGSGKNVNFYPPQRTPDPKQISLLTLSISEANKTLNFYAREPELLVDFTPFDFEFRETGLQKLSAAIKTGLDQELNSKDFERFECRQPALKAQFSAMGGDWKLLFSPGALIGGENLKSKVEFESGDMDIEFALVEFSLARFGTDELEFRSASSHVPFVMTLVLSRASSNCTIEIGEQFAGKQASAVLRYLDIQEVLRANGLIRITDLQNDAVLLESSATQISSENQVDQENQKKFRRLLEIVVAASKRWNLNIPMPTGLLDQDFEIAEFLDLLLTGKPISAMKVSIRKFVKTRENCDIMEDLPEEMIDVRLLQKRWEPVPLLFDVPIDTGPCTILIDKARVENYSETVTRFKAAQINEEIDVVLRPQGQIRVVLGDSLDSRQKMTAPEGQVQIFVPKE